MIANKGNADTFTVINKGKDDDTIGIATTTNFVFVDDVLGLTSIEIRVYP
jgi:hypothetical protein